MKLVPGAQKIGDCCPRAYRGSAALPMPWFWTSGSRITRKCISVISSRQFVMICYSSPGKLVHGQCSIILSSPEWEQVLFIWNKHVWGLPCLVFLPVRLVSFDGLISYKNIPYFQFFLSLYMYSIFIVFSLSSNYNSCDLCRCNSVVCLLQCFTQEACLAVYSCELIFLGTCLLKNFKTCIYSVFF